MMANPLLMPITPLVGADAIQHVIDHPAVKWEGVWWWTSHMTMLLVALAIVVSLGFYVAKKIDIGPESEGNDRYLTRNPFAHMIEVICLYLREEIVRPLLHERTDRFMPFLWTLFFFLLVCNLLGMVPLLDLYHLINRAAYKDHTAIIGGTPTQNLYVTAAMAIIAGITINVAGLKALGVKGYVGHLTAGAPWYVWPLIVPIEIAGQFIKPTALAIRLFANMTAGHILYAAILAFTGAGFAAGALLGFGVWAAATIGAIAIFFLEVFVAFLQAFIFTFLTTLFISLLQHHDEEHGHDEAHGHDAEGAAQPAMG